MSVDTIAISDSIFNHIEEKHKYPIEKVKVLVNKYDLQQKEEKDKKNADSMNYFEIYEKKRVAQKELYDQYLRERKELYEKAINDRSISSIQNLLNFKFQYEQIPEIYTYTDTYKDSIKKSVKNTRTSNENKLHKLKDSIKESIKKETKISQKPKKKILDLSLSPNQHEENIVFWNQLNYNFIIKDGIDMFFDKEDAFSLQNDELLTSSVINIFLLSTLQNAKYSNNYIIMKSEFYTYMLDIVKHDGDNNFEVLEKTFMNAFTKTNKNKRIIIPINISFSHWIMALINPVTNEIFVIDPYQKENKRIKDNLMIWWNWYSVKTKIESQLEDKYIISDIPKQPSNDVVNCGVIVSMYIYYLLNKNVFPTISDFDIKDIKQIREYMLNIVTTYLNSNDKRIKKNSPLPVLDVNKDITTKKECPPGKVLNPKTGRCIKEKKSISKTSDLKIKECPPGKVLNPETGRCIKEKSSILKTSVSKTQETLPTGKVLKSQTKECPPGKVLNPKTGRCIKEKK